MQVALYLAGEKNQVKESIPWVRCFSGNVFIKAEHGGEQSQLDGGHGLRGRPAEASPLEGDQYRLQDEDHNHNHEEHLMNGDNFCGMGESLVKSDISCNFQVFQCLAIEAENRGVEALRQVEPFLVSEQQWTSFLHRSSLNPQS